MSTETSKRWKTSSYLTLLGISVFAVIFIVNLLPAWRMDFTSEKLYTLSDGTEAIVNQLETPVALTFYFSNKVTANIPQLRDYSRRVQDLLEEYALLSGSNIQLTMVDPEPFSEAEDDATQAGLQAVPNGVGGENIFFGLVGSNEAGDQEVIAFFDPTREQFLEYDISQLIYRLQNSEPPVVGVITSLPMFGGFEFTTQRSTGPWVVVEQLKQLMEVRQLSPTLEFIEDDVDVLMLVHPQELPPLTRYLIDQFVLCGGKVMVFVDPHAEVSAQSMPSREANSSDIEELLVAWGINYDATKILGDASYAMRLPAGPQRLSVPHLAYLALDKTALDVDDIATAQLETMNFALAGYLDPRGDATTHIQTLIHSSVENMPLDAERFIGLTNHSDLLTGFSSTGSEKALAVKITGPAKSAFPDGRPTTEEEESADKTVIEEEGASVAEHVADSENISVIVVADADMLTDRLWVQINNFFGQRVAAPWANNGDFVNNSVENLAGSADLVSLRSRGSFARPFDVVEELQQEAAQRFQQQEVRLRTELEALEQKIQSLNTDSEGQIILALNDDQQREIKAFEDEKLAIRKELRQVQHQLNSDIETLEMRLKLANILGVPVILVMGVLLVNVLRRKRGAGH